MTRREFAAATGALALGGAAMAQDQAKTQPNILILHADQHRMECLGAYGNSQVRTPNIDALAADGVAYDNSFCPYPVCTPSRYSLLSGLYVHEHRGWTNHCTLPPGTDTFPSLLRTAGYKTKAVGKMHFTPTYFDVGFDEMVLSEQNGPGRWDDDYHRALMAEGLVDFNDLEDQERPFRRHARDVYWETFGALPSNLPDEWHSTTWIGDRAVETVEEWGAGGNLLMAGFIKPHHPFDPPKDWADRYDPATLDLLPGWTEECLPRDTALSRGYFPNEKLTPESMRRVMAYYYATISQIDHEVGRVIDVLKRKGLYDSTMIIYTSDHGDYMGYHHLLLKGNYLYDPLAKVPLIIKYPSNPGAGTRSDALVNNVDVAPTVLAQAGLKPSARMRGHDLAQDGAPDYVFSEDRRGVHAMARTKSAKLILDTKRDIGFFYDLEKDPHELTNRFEDPACRDEVARLTAAIREWRGPGPLSKVYLDEDAPVIKQPNVPVRNDGHREKVMAYFTKRMRDEGGLPQDE